ncbi:NUDIX hydrolase [Halorhabdus sp. BNX81]|uniref:NUDIX hydrolase n=1 Tax=Halorhabdus sp. BNX81 TaxID=2980181 RepID=UPI0023DCF709|nr:NUDIX hydrolase [Halorhabdus sp. BNX81]WEL20443.1 NUDIX family hydrolase [Halorhabdus sp. BNX81]
MSEESLAWETLSSETTYTCEGFDVITETVRLPDGTETEFDYLSEGESVVILPLTPDDEVVVIEEWRQPVRRVNYGLPAGSVEPDDEDLRTAVARELKEETGYEAGTIDHLTTVEPANGFSDAVFHYVLAEDCTPTGEQDLDYNESIRVGTTTVESLRGAARDDELRDGRTLLGVLYYELFGQ